MNKLAIVGVFAVFLLPVIAATLMHSQWFAWQPDRMRNHGELLQPVVALRPFEALDPDDEGVSREMLLDRWTLVYLGREECAAACLESLYWLRQIRRAQDRHQPDVSLAYTGEAPAGPATTRAIRELAPDFLVLAGAGAEEFWSQFPGDGVNSAFFIVDPGGNIILRYPDTADHNGIRRDLRRLLTWTQRD